MRRTIKLTLLAITFVSIFILLASSTFGQKLNAKPAPTPPMIVMYNFDFADGIYADNGVNPAEIIGRRNGEDGLSVFGKPPNANFTDVRVIVTIPAYTASGGITYWYPLGDLADKGFFDSKVGAMARETALMFPIYMFPDPRVSGSFSYADARQAPLIDDFWLTTDDNIVNPLGVREIVLVTFTEKAFDKEGLPTMYFFGKKNGLATDNTPLIKSTDDIQYLLRREFIKLEPLGAAPIAPSMEQFAISPVIADPTNGKIADDAFLWMSTIDGEPLAGEMMFVENFNCLKKAGQWCQ